MKLLPEFLLNMERYYLQLFPCEIITNVFCGRLRTRILTSTLRLVVFSTITVSLNLRSEFVSILSSLVHPAHLLSFTVLHCDLRCLPRYVSIRVLTSISSSDIQLPYSPTALGALTQVVWARALGLPIERPKCE